MEAEEAMMRWMEFKDHLIFESFEDFYVDLLKRLKKHGRKITLNNDLLNLKESRKGDKESSECFYNSSVLAYLPKIIYKMKQLHKNRL
jgi:hypothetical protein